MRWPALWFLSLFANDAGAQDPRWHGPDGPARGLPRAPLAFAPYGDDVDHPWNRVFRRLWLQHMAPAEVGDALRPDQAWRPGWVHGKRPGQDADTRWFGGDGRLLPLEGLDAAAAADLRPLLAAIARTGAAGAPGPELAVLFQHDLLRAAERLLDVGRNLDLVPALRHAAEAVALDADTLAALRDPVRLALADPGQRVALGTALPAALGGSAPGFREVERRSTRLFDAEKTLLWSRLFLAHPGGEAALAAMLPAARAAGDADPTVPIGFRAVLAQGIVAVDRDGVPRATPLVFEIRTQTLQNREPLSGDNPTWTHDGLDFGIWQLEREGLRRGVAGRVFRRIDPDDQDLFRDYGVARHTTYRGQCALCHRLSDTPEPELAGFPVLRRHAQARFAATGTERLRLAEQQAGRLLARLRAAR